MPQGTQGMSGIPRSPWGIADLVVAVDWLQQDRQTAVAAAPQARFTLVLEQRRVVVTQ